MGRTVTTMKNDLISRQAALSFPFANGKYDKEHANEDFILGCESYKEWLENLTAVDAVPVRHGWWIYKEDEFGCLVAECSVCHAEGMLHGNYCPDCGTRMDGKDGGLA